jgi:glucosamine--fructose-6-phosphate aminotransferase (isomerizing)
VARTREALQLLRQRDALGIAITANPDSPLAGAAEKVLDCTVPDFAPAPGVRSYRVSLMMLYLLAIRLGEVRGRYSQDEANALREELKGTADAIEATIEAVNDKTRQLAEEYAGENSYVFLGDGPNYATALFSAAKVIEAAGRHAMGQDTEEWAHLQYFASVETGTPTFIISPGYRAHGRAAELLGQMGRIGRARVAVVPEGDEAVAPLADRVLPVHGTTREAFTPMVYAVAGELFAAHLSDVVGEPPFRRTTAAYEQGNDIRISQVLDSLES